MKTRIFMLAYALAAFILLLVVLLETFETPPYNPTFLNLFGPIAATLLAVQLIWTIVLHWDRQLAQEEVERWKEAYSYAFRTFVVQSTADETFTLLALDIDFHIKEERKFRESYVEPEGKMPETAQMDFISRLRVLRRGSEDAQEEFDKAMKVAKGQRHSLIYRDHWTDYLPEEDKESTPPEVFPDAKVGEREDSGAEEVDISDPGSI